MTGHGGDEFLKFKDSEEISADDIANAIFEMDLKGRFNKLLFIVDTCQAATLCNKIKPPNVYCIASSLKGENSYAYNLHKDLGLPLMDRFTFSLTQFLSENFIKNTRKGRLSKKYYSLQGFIDSLDENFLYSTPFISYHQDSVKPQDISLLDFFSSKKRFFQYNISNPKLRMVNMSSAESNSHNCSFFVTQDKKCDKNSIFSSYANSIQSNLPVTNIFLISQKFKCSILKQFRNEFSIIIHIFLVYILLLFIYFYFCL
jgi:glycosylphosphatidylinositol transamidase (GPIT) subunit GPI8